MLQVAAILITAFISLPVFAATCTSTGSGGNWNNTGTWTGCNGGNGSTANTPGSNDTAIIATTGTNVVTANVAITVGNVVVNSGKLNIAGSNWTVSGTTTINNSGTIDETNTGGNVIFTGLVTVNTGGTWANTINEAFNFRGGITNNGTFNSGSGTYTFDTNNQAINGTISINNVTVTGVTLTNNNTLTVPTALSGTGGLTNSGTGTLNIGGTSGITTLTASAAGNTVNYTGAAQTVNPTTYHHLGLSGSGAKTLTNVSTINGNLTLSGTATATTAVALSIGGNLTVGTGSTFTSANFTNLVSGTTSVTGTLAHSGAAAKTYVGAVTINANGVWTNAGNAPVTFRGGLTHNGTTFTAGSGIYTFDTNNQAIGGSSAIAIPSITVTGVTLTNNGTLTVATDLSGTGGLTNSGTGTLNIGGTSGIATLTASASGNTVNYTGAAQTVIATTYHHLGLSGSGAKTFTSATVNGDLSLSGSATATLTGVSTISGNVTTSGTATATSAVALSIGGNLTVGTGSTFTSANFTNLVSGTTSVTGTLAHSGAAAKTYVGAVTINANGVWTNAGNAPVTFRGGLTHNGTTFTAGSGIYTFDTNNQAIGGSSAIAIPSITVTGVTLTNNGTLTVATDLSGTGGLTNSGTGTLNIGGTSGITTLTATAAGNTVSYTGTGQTIKATAYDTLNVTGTATNTGTVTAAAVLGGAGALTNSASGTLSIGGTSTITTLTATAVGNIVNYTGTGQIIKATAYDTLNVTGTATNSGTVTVATALSGSGTLTNSAAGTLNIGGTSGITTLTATAAGNTVSYTGTGQTIKATAYDTLSVSNTATNSGTVTVATALSGSGTLTNSALGTLNIGGTSGITTLTATAVGNTVNYTGAAQTVKATTYHHLGLSGSGAKTFTSATVNGDLSLSGSATATLTGVSTITGNVTTSGTATATTAANLSIGGNLTVGTGSAFTSANFTNLVSGTTSVTGTLAHSGLAAKTYTGTVTINAGGVWTNAGNAPITFSGGFAQNGTFTSGSGTYTFNGSSAQTITGTPTFQNLTINSNGGVTLSTGSVTVSTLLTLTSGTVTTGGNTLIASGGNCTTSISSSNGYVIGNLQLTVPATNPVTCSYPVGDSIGYAPISITKSGTNTGTLIGRVDSGDHPDGSSTVGINQAKNANHYWTLTAGTLSAATPYTATFQFCATGTCVVPTELDTGANTSNFVVAKKSGSWSNQTVGTKSATSTQVNGLTGFGVFEVGEQGSLNCTSLATGNWNTAATWTNCHGGVPLAGDTVTIVNTHTVTLDTTAPATGSLGSLTINSGGILTASVANTLTLGGNLTNNGTLSFGTFGSVTLTTASQWTGTGATWTLNNLTLGSQALSFNATDTFTLGINGSISGLGTINSGATNTGITLDFRSASTQTVPTTGVTYPNLTVSGGGTKTPASGTLDIRGNFTVAASTTFAGNTNNPAVTLKGGLTHNGTTFTAGSGIYTFDTNNQAIGGSSAIAIPSIIVTGVTLTNNGTLTVATDLSGTGGLTNSGTGTLNIGGTSGITTLTATAAGNTVSYTGTGQTIKATTYNTLSVSNTATNSGTITVATALSGSGTLTNSALGTLNIGGTSGITTLTATAVGNTVNYTGAAQTVKATTYHHLGLSGSGAKTFTSATVNGDLSLSGSATATLTGVSTITGNVTTGGTATATTAANLSIGGNLTVGTGSAFTSANFTNLVSGTTSVTGTLAHSGLAAKTYTGTVTINAGGVWTNAGNAPITFSGGFAQNGTFTSGSGTYTFNGSSAQTITGTPTFQNLTINSNGGVTLSTGSVTVSTLLTLTSGTVTTGSNILIASGASCVTSVSRTSGYVIGNLRLTFPASSTTCSFPVGSGTAYAPIQVTNTGAGTLTGSTTGSDLPPSASSNVDASKDANRYWTLWATGDTIASTSYTPTFNFVSGDLDSGAVATSFIVGKLLSSTWSNPTMGSAGATSTSTAAITGGFGGAPNVFVVGQFLQVNCTSNVISGSWNTSGTWTNCRGGVPLAGDTATIAGGHNVTLNVNTPAISTLTVNGILTNSSSNTMTLAGDMVVALGGTYTGGSGAVSIVGNLTNSGTFNPGSATWTFAGTTAQSISGVTAGFNKLTLNNSNGLTLNSNVSVTTLLTLTSGILNTGTYKLTTLANCPGSVSTTAVAGSGASTDKFVYGNLQLTFPSGTTTCTFNVGSGTAYTPVGVTLTTTLLGGGTLTATTYGSEHPQLVFSGIEPSKDANRYWTLGSAVAPADTISVSSYSPTFNFTAGDLDVSATATNFSIGKYAASTWTLPSPVTANAYSTVLSTITASLGVSSVTDFMVGEATPLCTVPPNSLAGTVCQCDFFTRTNLNPSTIFGGNWNLSSTGTTFYTPQINTSAGHMQLTPNLNNVSTSATLPGTFPAAGNKISVEFKHYAYGGTAVSGSYGADGIALTLSDSTIAPVAGAFGGSLGYAQKCQNGVSGCVSDCSTVGGCPGFSGGWIGIGIDEYGNFSFNGEGRSGGSAPGPRTDSVAARGSGSGQTGYPYLGGTGSLTPGIGDDTTLTPSYGHAYRLIVDATNYTPSNRTATVTLDRDTTGTGNSYTNLINLPNIYTTNPSQADVPTNWIFSYTGSTGSSKNIHEIAGLKVCGQSFIPPAGYRILVDNLKPTTCAATGSPTLTVSALDNNGNVITGYDKTVVLSATLLGGGVSHASLSSQATNQGIWVAGTKSYTFVAADNGVAKFTLTDSTQEDVYITVSESGGTLNSTALSPVQYRSGVATYTLANVDNLAADTGGGVVAGRPHRFRVTRNLVDCGGTDTSYNGRKYLDGWYTPASGDHPNGAGQPQVCTTNTGGTCLPAPGSSCQTMSIAEPALDPNSNNMPMDFAAGISDFCLVTNDVGKYSIYLRDDLHVNDVPTVAAAIGTSSTLTARPFTIVVSDIFQGSAPNPASSLATVSGPFVAGSNFSAKVGGYLWNNSADSTGGASGLPGLVNKTTMISAGLAPHYADTVTLAPDTSLATNFVPNGSDTVQGAVANGVVTVTNGSGTTSTLNYSEVGSFTLKATASSNYLNSGVDLANRVRIFADNVNLTTWVGRFRPDHFSITSPATITPGCGTFTYFGQDGFTTVFHLNALNALGSPTLNYIGDGSSTSWAKLPLTAWGEAPASASSPGYGFAVSTWSPSQPVGAVFSASVTHPTTTNTNTWVSGTTMVTAKHQITRPNAPAAPTTVNVSALPVDSDGVTMTTAFTLASATPLRYGRLALQNAYGSELLDLPMPLTAEYWDGHSWMTNAADQCTTGITLSATDNIATDGLIPAVLFVWDTGVGSGNSGLGYPVAGTVANRFSQPPALGNFNLNFRAPGIGNTGSLDITATVPDYLKFKWNGVADGNPTGRVTFGIYKGNSRFIYIRELY